MTLWHCSTWAHRFLDISSQQRIRLYNCVWENDSLAAIHLNSSNDLLLPHPKSPLVLMRYRYDSVFGLCVLMAPKYPTASKNLLINPFLIAFGRALTGLPKIHTETWKDQGPKYSPDEGWNSNLSKAWSSLHLTWYIHLPAEYVPWGGNMAIAWQPWCYSKY